MNIYFVVNARMPSKKAYGIHIAKMCEAFAANGAEVTLVIPRTRASRTNVCEFYGLAHEVSTMRLPAPDWYGSGSLGFATSSLAFMLSSFWYLITRSRHDAVIYTTDMDTFSGALLPFAGLPVFTELHDWRGDGFFMRTLLTRTRGIIATNAETAKRVKQAFGAANVLVEPNGFDKRWLTRAISKREARMKLALPRDARIALYVGRFYAWKGLAILARAAAAAPGISWYVVGGSKDEFIRETEVQVLPPNLQVAGECTFDEVPTWLSAADVLLLVGTKRNAQSWLHTSPMKVYEYMALSRPIVASRTRALQNAIPEDMAVWSESDNPDALAQAVQSALDTPPEEIFARGRMLAEEHTWTKRACRIMESALAV